MREKCQVSELYIFTSFDQYLSKSRSNKYISLSDRNLANIFSKISGIAETTILMRLFCGILFLGFLVETLPNTTKLGIETAGYELPQMKLMSRLNWDIAKLFFYRVEVRSVNIHNVVTNGPKVWSPRSPQVVFKQSSSSSQEVPK